VLLPDASGQVSPAPETVRGVEPLRSGDERRPGDERFVPLEARAVG